MAEKKQGLFIIIAILIIAALGYAAYSYFGLGFSGTPPSVTSTENPVENQEFVALLNTLQETKIDTSFFQDPSFRSLQDPLNLEDVSISSGLGRVNPFSPLGN